MKKNIFINEINGLEYRKIANIMTSSGFKMNHSSVRNYINRGCIKIIDYYANENNIKLSKESVYEIAKSKEFQDALYNVLKEI